MSDPSYSTKSPSAAQADTPPDDPSQLGGYRIVKKLGQGGMGLVYQAEDPQLRRSVALKVMRPEIAANDQARRRFSHEAQAAAKLKHDHIVTIYQVNEDRGVPFLAMEFLQGKSLEDWLRPDRRATVPEALAIGKQIAKGLAAAHAADLIHRDIKPANIWLEAPRGRVKILDFGLARHMTELTHLTQDGAVLGTPAFMAPEQGRGEQVDPRCDLFSLGCVLYRMVTGRLPFQGHTAFAVLAAVASETPPPVRELNPNVPPRLAELIARLLAKDSKDRPASAQEVWDELNAVEKETRQTSATPTIAVEPSAARRPVPRALIFGLIGGILALTAVVAFLAWNRDAQPEPRGKIEDPAGDAESPPKPIDVLKLIDLERDSVRGGWSLRDGQLTGQPQKKDPIFHLVLPWDPPLEYRLKFTATRVTKGGNAAVALAGGKARFVAVFDVDYKKKLISGIGFIDGKKLADRPDLFVGKVFPPGRPVTVACTIRTNSIRVEADGRKIVDLSGDLQRCTRVMNLGAEPLGLGGAEGSFVFKDIVLEPLGADAGAQLLRKP